MKSLIRYLSTQIHLQLTKKHFFSSTFMEETKQVLRSADAVCFDVDSTLLQDEGLDELAKFCGVGEEVQEWTRKAMGGGVSFREALVARLNIIKPAEKNLHDFIATHKPQFSPGIKELISALHKKNVAVYLVSGGFERIIQPAADVLAIPHTNIYANRLIFGQDGNYAGFDKDRPTSSSGGKQVVAQTLKDQHGYKKLVMVGDGMTDMEACPPADAFIGYGGNVIREAVKNNAPWFVTDLNDLLQEVNKS